MSGLKGPGPTGRAVVFAALLIVGVPPEIHGDGGDASGLLFAEAAETRDAPRLAEVVPPVSKMARLILIHEGRLTVAAHNEPLKVVLHEIEQKSGLRIFVARSLDERLSASFEGLPLEEGLQRLLEGQNVIFIYGPSEGGPPSRIVLTEVVVLSKGAGDQRAGDQHEGFRRLAKEAWEAADPALRKRAVEALGESGELEAIGPLTEAALDDGELEVRMTALEALQRLLRSAGPEVLPLDALVEAALRRDDDAQVRMMALEILQEIAWDWEPRAIEALSQALRDPDPDVAAVANRLLEELNFKQQGRAYPSAG
jgi:hypothetical protein